MRWKEEVAAYFQFTRRDRIAVFVLAGLILLVWLLPGILGAKMAHEGEPGDTSWVSSLRKLEQKDLKNELVREEYQPQQYAYDRSAARASFPRVSLFYFDPNTATEEDWKKLGLRSKTISTILNFRGKGGRFREAEDLRKIYGLFPDEYAHLAPYVKIGSPDPVQKVKSERPMEYLAATKTPLEIEINGADTSAFIALPGIGAKLAGRIVAFRDKLGGFVRIEQVAEVFGLADSTFRKIRPFLKLVTSNIRRLNINTATMDELKSHPYIRYQLARPLIAYRETHGPYKNLTDLRNVMAVTEDVYEKLLPYLSVN